MRRKGSALVEFALASLVLYVLVAGGIELGRMIFLDQVLQDAARIAARELSVTALAADDTFDCLSAAPGCLPTNTALGDPQVLTTIWNPNLLVIDTSCYPIDPTTPSDAYHWLNTYLLSLPVVNRALQPVFITETYQGRSLMRFPAAALPSGTPSQNCPATYQAWMAINAANRYQNPSDLSVGVPQLLSGDGIQFLPVLQETRNAADPPECGPFSLVPPDPTMCANPPTGYGVVALTINFPFQSGALSSHSSAGDGVQGNFGSTVTSTDTVTTDSDLGTYTGPNGLGNQVVGPMIVRPYRKLLVGQAIFRREVTN